MIINSANELKVYKAAYELAMAIFEISKTETWLNFAKDCGYLSMEDHVHLSEQCRSVGKMIGSMLKKPELFLLKL